MGLHAEILVLVVHKYRMFERELKMADDKKKHSIWALLLSLLVLTTSFQQNYHNNQARGKAKRNGRPLLP